MGLLRVSLLGLVILLTHFIEGITGFGCTVLALPFCISLIGIKVAVPVLIVIGGLLALYIIIIDFKNIVWKEYIKIVSFVILGLPIGMWLFNILPDAILKKLLGVFMIVVAVRGLYLAFKSKSAVECREEAGHDAVSVGLVAITSLKKYLLNFILFFGGIIHGAFGSGGPFIVIYATKALPDKSNFRATLCMLWVTLNSIMIFKNIKSGVMTTPVCELILWMLPFLAAGMILGNYTHKKINGNSFLKVVYVVLLLSGVLMMV
jgi:uncharacterized membrane protein YfcA